MMISRLCVQEFCVDVSTYQPVVWVERNGQECSTGWVKQCEDKSENVCIDVTETICEVSCQSVTPGWTGGQMRRVVISLSDV